MKIVHAVLDILPQFPDMTKVYETMLLLTKFAQYALVFEPKLLKSEKTTPLSAFSMPFQLRGFHFWKQLRDFESIYVGVHLYTYSQDSIFMIQKRCTGNIPM